MIRTCERPVITGLVFWCTLAAANNSLSAGVFICDLRKVFGTCHEYYAAQLSSEAEDHYRTSCTRNHFDNNRGEYFTDRHCPKEMLVGACLDGNNIPWTDDGWRYDKYYYNGTSEHYPWQPEGFADACKKTGGRLVIH